MVYMFEHFVEHLAIQVLLIRPFETNYINTALHFVISSYSINSRHIIVYIQAL